jgi:hypothetical protein
MFAYTHPTCEDLAPLRMSANGTMDLDLDLADGYGPTSLDKVVFLMSACDDTGVSLAEFTKTDVAGLRTAPPRHAGTVA